MIYWKFACRKYYMYWKWQSLLSIKKLTLAGYEARLTVNTTIIRLDDDNIAEAKEYRNTCKLKVHLCDHINAITKFTNNPNFKLWYHRLWHHKWKAIKKIESENLITGLKIKGQKEENITHECCIQGKMTIVFRVSMVRWQNHAQRSHSIKLNHLHWWSFPPYFDISPCI